MTIREFHIVLTDSAGHDLISLRHRPRLVRSLSVPFVRRLTLSSQKNKGVLASMSLLGTGLLQDRHTIHSPPEAQHRTNLTDIFLSCLMIFFFLHFKTMTFSTSNATDTCVQFQAKSMDLQINK